MHKLMFAALLLFSGGVFAQDETATDEPEKGKFKKENIFIGGSLNLGLSSGGFAVGIVPEVGYSITRWLDAGLVFNLNYASQNNVYDNFGDGPYQVRDFNYGGGTFVRIWPFQFLNISVQPEYNWIRSSQEYQPTGYKGTYTFKAESLLVGIGYGSRQVGSSQTYVNIMVDVLKNPYSPYRDQANRGRPIIRTGFGIYLGRGRR